VTVVAVVVGAPVLVVVVFLLNVVLVDVAVVILGVLLEGLGLLVVVVLVVAVAFVILLLLTKDEDSEAILAWKSETTFAFSWRAVSALDLPAAFFRHRWCLIGTGALNSLLKRAKALRA
jgi:hypothetical protein